MFGNSNYGSKPGGVQKAVSALGTSIGLGCAVMAAPLVFARTKTPLTAYFLGYVKDGDITLILVWLMNGIFSFVIFAIISMLLSFALIWVLAKIASKTLG